MGYWLQRISIILVAVAGIILAPIACVFMLQGDYIWVGAAVGLLVVVLFLSQDVRKQWVYVVCGLSVTGTLNFLPLNFSVSELAIMMVFVHFFLSEVIFKKRGIVFGSPWMVGAVCVIAVIVLFHWFKEGIGLRVLGGGSVGARKSISMMMGFVGYFIVLTLCQDQWKLLNRLPLIYFIVGCVSAIPFIVTTLVPSSGPIVYAFYGDINADAYLQMVSGEESIGRSGKYASVAISMALALLAYYPVKEWWRPNRWWILVLWLAGFWMCMASGYRNSVFGYILVFLVGSFASSKFRAIFLWMFAVFALALAVAGQGTLFELPFKVQRAISFLPGKWDYSVISDASSSDDFRGQIQDIYIKEFLYNNPTIGGGFNYDASEVKGQTLFEKKWDADPYSMFKGFIIRKDYHVGWISLYDTIGFVGAIAFTVMCICGITWLVIMVMKSGDKHPPPIVVWLLACWIPGIISYFAVFGAIQQMYPVLCIHGALIWCTYQAWKKETEEGTEFEKVEDALTTTSELEAKPLRSLPKPPLVHNAARDRS